MDESLYSCSHSVNSMSSTVSSTGSSQSSPFNLNVLRECVTNNEKYNNRLQHSPKSMKTSMKASMEALHSDQNSHCETFISSLAEVANSQICIAQDLNGGSTKLLEHSRQTSMYLFKYK